MVLKVSVILKCWKVGLSVSRSVCWWLVVRLIVFIWICCCIWLFVMRVGIVVFILRLVVLFWLWFGICGWVRCVVCCSLLMMFGSVCCVLRWLMWWMIWWNWNWVLNILWVWVFGVKCWVVDVVFVVDLFEKGSIVMMVLFFFMVDVFCIVYKLCFIKLLVCGWFGVGSDLWWLYFIDLVCWFFFFLEE